MSDTLTKQDLKEVLQSYPTKDDLKEALKDYPTKQELRQELEANNKELVNQLGALLENAIHGIDGIQENIDGAKEVRAEIESDIKPRLSVLEQKTIA